MSSTSNEARDWQAVLDQLARIREESDFATGNVEFIREQMQSEDDRIRAAATLAAEGCIFEPYVMDLVIDIVENDPVAPIRKAALQALQGVIEEGLAQELEDDRGYSTQMDDVEEWEEYQSTNLQEDYQRVKAVLMYLIETDDDPEIQGLALASLGPLADRELIREKIGDLIEHNEPSVQRAALQAISNNPQEWEAEIGAFLDPDTPTPILREAIAAAFSSESAILAEKITLLLNHEDPEVLRYAILTLGNINKTPNLGDMLQHFSLHNDTSVRAAARDAIDLISDKNFDHYMRDSLGMSGGDAPLA